MANINKSFNFRNGVQVDEDNFIVNENGLVGIGTSIPREILDVYGTAKITGLVTTTNLAVSGVSTFYNNVKVGSGITAVASTGIIYANQFVGSAAGLTGIIAIATDGWIVGSGTLSTTAKVGIGTTIPYYSLQVGNDPLTGNGFSVDAITGNVNTTGILTAASLKTIGSITGYNFSGFGTDITGINATNISNGTLNNSRLPSSINLTGIITGYSLSGFGTNITGINATNISNGTLNNSRLPTNLNISGIITSTSLTVGFASITHLYVSGVTTSLQGFVGNLVGIASTALSLSGSPSITVTNITSTNINNSGVVTSSNLHIGTGGVNFTALSSGKVGIGTTNPTSELQIIKQSDCLLEVISNTGVSRISIGQTVGVGQSTAVFRFGGSEKTLDIINNDTGDINLYLHAGPAGIGTGRFDWIYGQTNAELMSLTYEGKLGIGKTNPNETVHIVGTSTVTSNAYFGNHIYVKENIYFKSLRDGVVETNTNVTNGISTFSTLYLYGGANILGIATNNAGSYKFKIEDNSPAYLGNNVGIGTTNANDPANSSQSLLKVFGNSYLRSANIGTSISIGSGIVTATSFSGSASGLYLIPAGNLIGALPAIDGSSLTGIVGSGSGIVVKDSGTTVGTAATIDFGDNLTVSAISAGIVTVTGSAGGGGSSQFVTTAAGIHTLSNVGIGTTNPTSVLTVSGDVKVTGIITASSFSGNATSATYASNAGIATYATNAGIATYASNAGIATYASNAGIATYATTAGIATYASNAGIATYATTAGIATYASNAGIATYATSAGIATNAQGLTGTPNLNVGVVTATSFIGNGSGLTNLIGVGVGIVIKDSGSTVGTAGTIDFGDNLTVSAISAGIVTVTGSTGNSGIATYATSAGIATYATSAGIATYATSAGIATYATSAGIATYATNSGISTYTSEWILGANGTSDYTFTGPGLIGAENDPVLYLVRGQQYKFTNTMGQHPFRIQSTPNGSAGTEYNDGITNNNVSNGTLTWNVQFDTPSLLYYNCTVGGHGSMGGKIYIIDAGIGPDISINTTGIISATTFVGSFSGSITDATNLTGGYANSSQLNVSGVATISQGRIQADGSSNLRFGNIAAGSGSGRNIAIGDQVLYSLSSGQGRNIGIGELSYYDTTSGQYNIGLGIQAGQKITTGNYNVILGGYDGQTGLDIRTLSNNVVIADGQGNIRQYINSSGNVGIKTTVITEALTVVGIVSATSFYGTLNAGQLTGTLPAINGSALIGVVGSGSGVIIQGNGTPVGTAGTINFGSNINVTFASGIATVSGNGLATYANVAGIATYASTAGVSTTSGTANYATNAGVSTTSGTAGYATTAGISSAVSGTININTTGIITASSFSGSGSGLTNIPAAQLTGTLPAIDGSALLNVTAAGTGIAIRDDNSNIGSATTVNFGTGLDVTFSSGIATITASGGSLQSRTTVSGVTTSIANLGIGNTNITGFKSYALMKVGLSTTGWLRLYTDNTSRANDAFRSVGEDPAPGSGVIAEVVTTGISTTQIISPFVMGGNLDNSPTTTIYAAIKNLSGTTQSITANLTILQLEA